MKWFVGTIFVMLTRALPIHGVQEINISSLSCDSPYTISTATRIIVDQDFTITGICAFITAAPSFSSTVEFYTATPRTITVDANGTWDLTSFATATIKFSGQTIVKLKNGSIIKGNGVHIIFADQSTFTQFPSTSIGFAG